MIPIDDRELERLLRHNLVIGFLLGIVFTLIGFTVFADEPLEARLLGMMTRSANYYLRDAAKGFDTTRRAPVQARLFREDLEWQSRGFSDLQLDAMVYVTMVLSGKRATREADALEETGVNPEILLRIMRIRNYATEAARYAEALHDRVRDAKRSELRFYF